MSKFEICKVSTGYTFHLKAKNGEVIVTSEVYSAKSSAKREVKSLMQWVAKAKVEDTTLKDYEAIKNPKFEVYEDKGGKYRFRLKAKNGEIVAVSQGYTSKKSCINGVESVQANAPIATIINEEEK